MVAVGIFLLLCFALFVINSGSQIQRRAQAQNNSDMVALTGTAWIARELNLISMANTAMAMSLAEIEMYKATLLTANTMTRYGREWMTELCHSQPESCVEATEQYANITAITTELNDNVNTGEGIVAAQETLWELAAQLTEAEAALALSMPPAALDAAQTIGASNAARTGVISPYPAPPIRVARINALCPLMFLGSPGGYEPNADGFGPLYGVQQSPFLNLWSDSAPIYEAATWFEALLTGRAGLTCVSREPDPFAAAIHPFVMSRGWERQVQYYGIAAYEPGSVRAPLAPNRFQAEKLPIGEELELARKQGLLTVARAELYNPYQPDTFTPQWRTRLIPVVQDIQEGPDTQTDFKSDSFSTSAHTSDPAIDTKPPEPDVEEFDHELNKMIESISWFITH